jgi:hypothetical protein
MTPVLHGVEKKLEKGTAQAVPFLIVTPKH